MLNEDALTGALSGLEYRRIKRRVYRATWSPPDVGHFLYVSLYGRPKEFLTVDFGIRNDGAQAFGVECVRAYGGPLYQLLRHDERVDCFMRFSLARLADWGSRTSLYLPGMSEALLLEKITTDIRGRLFPLIRGVVSTARLLTFLLKDAEPCRWMYVNAAMRAGQVAYLARMLGMQRGDTEAMLRPLEQEMKACLARGMDPASYVTSVVDRSANVRSLVP